MTFKEVTKDNGTAMAFAAADNNAQYILTSAIAKDMRAEYARRYNRLPSSRWYNRHFSFNRL